MVAREYGRYSIRNTCHQELVFHGNERGGLILSVDRFVDRLECMEEIQTDVYEVKKNATKIIIASLLEVKPFPWDIRMIVMFTIW